MELPVPFLKQAYMDRELRPLVQPAGSEHLFSASQALILNPYFVKWVPFYYIHLDMRRVMCRELK